MLNKVKKMTKGFAKQVAISLFFSSFFIVGVYFLFGNKLSNLIFLVNRLVIVEAVSEEKEISFDVVKKKLVNYPSYGSVWATIKIPDISLNAVIYHGDTLEILDKGTGHFVGSYFPGEGGTVILAGHNSDEQFGRIPGLDIGDEIIIEAQYGSFTYKITSGEIINAEVLEKTLDSEIQDNKEILILYTCYPIDAIGYKTDRYVIHAELTGEKYEN